MKKIFCFMIVLLVALPLTSCGKTAEYTYDYLTEDFARNYILGFDVGSAIKGGAYFSMPVTDLEGNCHQGTYTSIKCIFNEDTKVVMPLCWDVACDHTTLDCFGKLYRHDSLLFTDIYEDEIFLIELSPEVKNQLEVVYFGLDGTVNETVKYSPKLIMPNGELLEDRFVMTTRSYLSYGTKLYFDISTEALGADEALELGESEVEFVHWIVSYDLEEKKWDLVTSIPYLLPDNIINIVDVNDTKFSFSENGIGYTVDYITGETEAFDCAVIIDEMIESGKLPVGSILDDVYPLRDCFGCFADNKYSHYRISTREPLDASEITYATDSSKFSYDGELYALDLRQVCTNVNTGEKIEIALDGTTIIFLCETENGIIFKYLNRLEDGNLEPQTYVIKENGKDIMYWYPSKYVYATKADIMDGRIDEPWYYDAETYSFIRQ